MKGNHRKLLLALIAVVIAALATTGVAFAYQANKAQQEPKVCTDIAACCENAEEAVASVTAANGEQAKVCTDPEGCCADAEQVNREVAANEQANRG